MIYEDDKMSYEILKKIFRFNKKETQNKFLLEHIRTKIKFVEFFENFKLKRKIKYKNIRK